MYNQKLEELFNVKNLDTSKITDKQKNIAASAQKIFEKKIIDICIDIENMNISKNLVYAGGCALNSLANKKLYETNIFENIYIPFAPADGGGSIGSALYTHKKIDKTIEFKNLKNPYLGNKYDDIEIKKIIEKVGDLKKYNCQFYEKKDELLLHTAKLIFENSD